jgi:NADPH:quinone reductase-like Zn-dependent oxidoreductase
VVERLEYLNLLKELAEEDIIQVVIDREFPLENIREAHAYVETGRKKGNVVITMES